MVVFLSGCGKTSGADLPGMESEPWVFKGGVSGEVQVKLTVSMININLNKHKLIQKQMQNNLVDHWFSFWDWVAITRGQNKAI